MQLKDLKLDLIVRVRPSASCYSDWVGISCKVMGFGYSRYYPGKVDVTLKPVDEDQWYDEFNLEDIEPV